MQQNLSMRNSFASTIIELPRSHSVSLSYTAITIVNLDKIDEITLFTLVNGHLITDINEGVIKIFSTITLVGRPL